MAGDPTPAGRMSPGTVGGRMQHWAESLVGTSDQLRRAVRLVGRALLLLLLLFAVVPLHADPLGAFLLEAIEKSPGTPPSKKTLLLLTTDLGWYEQNMSRLSPEIQDQVQQLRISVVGESTRKAAESLGAKVKSSARGMYHGASGQRFFVFNYLGEEDGVR